MKVAVVGAGVAGLCCATELLKHGVELSLYERGDSIGQRACSWFAGGMLAPNCEREAADEAVAVHGQQALGWWNAHTKTAFPSAPVVMIGLMRTASRAWSLISVAAFAKGCIFQPKDILIPVMQSSS